MSFQIGYFCFDLSVFVCVCFSFEYLPSVTIILQCVSMSNFMWACAIVCTVHWWFESSSSIKSTSSSEKGGFCGWWMQLQYKLFIWIDYIKSKFCKFFASFKGAFDVCMKSVWIVLLKRLNNVDFISQFVGIISCCDRAYLNNKLLLNILSNLYLI